MLEDLGLGEAPSREEADVVVFNTCTIREKPDTKFAAYIGDAIAQKRRSPDTVIAVGGCYAEAQRERLFTLYPEVDVAFGPGRSRTSASGSAPAGSASSAARSASPRSGASPRRCRCTASAASRRGCRSRWAATRSARTASSPPVRGREVSRRPGEILAEVTGLAARRRQGGHAARPERQLVGPRARHRVRRAPPCVRRRRRHRADPLHVAAPEGLPPPGDRGDGRMRRGLRAHASAAPVRARRASSRRCGARIRASATCASPTSCARRFPTSR